MTNKFPSISPPVHVATAFEETVRSPVIVAVEVTTQFEASVPVMVPRAKFAVPCTTPFPVQFPMVNVPLGVEIVPPLLLNLQLIVELPVALVFVRVPTLMK